MDYFNEEAILSYILLIDISNDNNLLEPSDYINRIKFLINSIDPKSELLNTIKTKYRSILIMQGFFCKFKIFFQLVSPLR